MPLPLPLPGALGVLGHEDEAASRARVLGGLDPTGHRFEQDAGRPDGPGEHLAQPVVCHLADEAGHPTQRGHADHRVGGRPARHLGPLGGGGADDLGLGQVDEGHGALDETQALELGVGGRRQHVDQ